MDRSERAWPGQYNPGLPHGHPAAPPDEVHNDPFYLSWDLYNMVPVSTPFGAWGPGGYVTSSVTINNIGGQNQSAELEPYRAAGYAGGDIVAAVEYALRVRSLAEPPLCPRLPPTPTPRPTQTPYPADQVRTVVLQQGLDGYRGVQDTHINAWFPAQNFGREGLLEVRSEGHVTPLLRFDLGAIPPGATVLDARLTVFAVAGGWYEQDISAYQVLREWAISEITWREAKRGVSWAEAGCKAVDQDRAGVPSNTVLAITGTSCEFDVTDMAQRWVSAPASNAGLLLQGSAGAGIAVQHNLASSEYWHMALRPKLEVTYWVGP
jgi:hypothetical protein